MAAKIKKKVQKKAPKPATRHAIKKVIKGKKKRNDTDEMNDLERDVDRGEDIEIGISRPAKKEEAEKIDHAKEEDDGAEVYEYGERGILSEEDEDEY